MNKKLIFGLILGAILLAGAVFATAQYFHTVQTTIVVDEGRSSADLPLTIYGFSGETTCRDVTIQNHASVPLNSVLSYVENSNPEGIIYTSNLDGGIQVTTPANVTSTYQACFTLSPVTVNGTVQVTINYMRTV